MSKLNEHINRYINTCVIPEGETAPPVVIKTFRRAMLAAVMAALAEVDKDLEKLKELRKEALLMALQEMVTLENPTTTVEDTIPTA